MFQKIPPPPAIQTSRSESINRRQRRGRDELKCDVFRKGVTSRTPPSHVQDEPGFRPWKTEQCDALNMGKWHPWASPSPRLSPKMPSTPSSMPCQLAHTLLEGHLERHRRAGCRIAASAAIPSGWAHRTGHQHHLAACDTLLCAEAVSGCRRRPRHMWHPRQLLPGERAPPPGEAPSPKGLGSAYEDGEPGAPDQRSRLPHHPRRP